MPGRGGCDCGCSSVSSLNSDTFHALYLVLNQVLSTSPPRPRSTVMPDLLATYSALSSSSPRADVSKVLNAIISGLSSSIAYLLPHRSDFCPALVIDNACREALVSALLSDLASCKPGSTNGRLRHTGTSSIHPSTAVTPHSFLRCPSRSFSRQGFGPSSVRVVRHSAG